MLINRNASKWARTRMIEGERYGEIGRMLVVVDKRLWGDTRVTELYDNDVHVHNLTALGWGGYKKETGWGEGSTQSGHSGANLMGEGGCGTAGEMGKWRGLFGGKTRVKTCVSTRRYTIYTVWGGSWGDWEIVVPPFLDQIVWFEQEEKKYQWCKMLGYRGIKKKKGGKKEREPMQGILELHGGGNE